jgi:hypothetical protein
VVGVPVHGISGRPVHVRVRPGGRYLEGIRCEVTMCGLVRWRALICFFPAAPMTGILIKKR